MNVIGTSIVDGVPHINGKPAARCVDKSKCYCGLLGDAVSEWKCPECGAHLSPSNICMNACHLSGAAYRRLQNGLR
jgi:hypothetical protein